ncbi:uncharacterized protein LOC125944236 [Dermacentor silvarum]|uniref:uncharacterized protein LOC125944236 n=1 Tax=Dermacentor silvarum TaxID=543639 RepID=UPI002100CA85|nr:uncharacterized protein LOC125944236 [Dermacentor silvarum]
MRIGKEVTGDMYVCSEHFKQEDYFWSHFDGSLKPRLPRLKKGAVPSLKIPVRTHETQVEPRPSRRKVTEASHGMKPDDLPPAVSREEVCACVPQSFHVQPKTVSPIVLPPSTQYTHHSPSTHTIHPPSIHPVDPP